MLLIIGNFKEFNVCNLKLVMNKEIRIYFFLYIFEIYIILYDNFN